MHLLRPLCEEFGKSVHGIDMVKTAMCVLQENVLKLLRPWKNLSVGEAMIKFDGMLLWKQYMPKKPVRWGIKIWCLCDSLKGYGLAFNV